MTCQSPLFRTVVPCTLILAMLVGCTPQQAVYFREDGDLSHYIGKATEIDYPDSEEPSLADAEGAIRPFSLDNTKIPEVWELTLEDAVRIALSNNKIMKDIGGAVGLPGQRVLSRPGSLPLGGDAITRAPDAANSVYNPALAESDPRQGVEGALSAFDALFTTSVFWEKNDSPRNTFVFGDTESPAFPAVFEQDLCNFQAAIQKTAATGGTWIMRHNVQYDWQNSSRVFPSDWNVNVEAEFRQPLMQGYGVQYNRIAGPGAVSGFYNGVIIARLRTDVALTDFEASVRNLVLDVEKVYWLVYFAYRRLDAMIAGRDSALRTWRETYVKYQVGTASSYEEARSRNQYFLFRSQVEGTLSELYAAESHLRYMLGIAATDGRLIRPKDEPTVAKVTFDWHDSLAESMFRAVELRRQKWIVKWREMELIASKNFLLPKVDAVGRYRWLGMGDDLIDSNGGSGNPAQKGSNAYQSMTNGNYQEWQLGIDFEMFIGQRRAHSGVRNAQLQLARDRALLQEAELEISHQLAHRIRTLESLYVVCQTNFNRRVAAEAEVEAAKVMEKSGHAQWTLDDVLDAQRRLAEAEVDYYSTLVDYNTMIAEVHYRKGSLLEYNGVHLAEGPWPGKAYFDAHGRARKRDAATFIDYGFTRPKVISRGRFDQGVGQGMNGPILEGNVIEGGTLDGAIPEGAEILPAPVPDPIGGPQAAATPSEPKVTEPTGTGPTGTGPTAKATTTRFVVNTPTPAKRSSNAGWTATVKQASYEEPKRNEPVANSSTAATDWAPANR